MKTYEETISERLDNAKLRTKGLKNKLRYLIKEFGDGCDVKASAEINANKCIYNNEPYGTEIIERINVVEKENYLFGLIVTRKSFISVEYFDEVEASADDSVNLELYWNDRSDRLTYFADNYPSSTNEAIVEQAKALIEAAESIIENAWTKR